MGDSKPLVLDVDGTFLKTDLLYESFWAGLGQAPLATLRAVAGDFRRPARLKARLASIVTLRTDLMPVNPEVADVAMQALRDGRQVVLASASDQRLVRELAGSYGLSPEVFASSPEHNLKGPAKAEALVAAYGAGGFDYAGNARVDRAIWARADTALVVGDDASARALQKAGKPVQSLAGGWKLRDLIRALRPHQWVKNVLLFLPMLAAHDFSLQSFWLVLLGIMAFSAAASAIYIVNDLLDLEADRLHETKRHRPFASGAVPISVGMAAGLFMALLALGVGMWLGAAFLVTILIYMVLSLAYSLRLKRLRWIDLATLAGLYTLRVIAGVTAMQGELSVFLVVFIYPIFLSLGCVKRMTELSLAKDDARLPGRGYGKADMEDLLNIAYLGMFGALMNFFLYSFSEQATRLYPTRWLLWLALVPIALWLWRMIRLGYTGQQDYDPVVFAMKDKRGIGLILATLTIMFAAAGLWKDWYTTWF
ncbi:MAG TPA: UbiA family prenyltransferase [Rhodobacteraceae bacterium]|nr:UbiA family prenyltransferase [Paracoccaceae bacterium]